MREEFFTITQAAEKHAREISFNEDKIYGFKKGVVWAVRALLANANNDTGTYNVSSSTKAYLAKLSLKDVRKFCEEALTESERGGEVE